VTPTLAEHDFSKTPDECPRCQERRARGRKLQPATAPGIIDTNSIYAARAQAMQAPPKSATNTTIDAGAVYARRASVK
jgi:hypothetical protein